MAASFKLLLVLATAQLSTASINHGTCPVLSVPKIVETQQTCRDNPLSADYPFCGAYTSADVETLGCEADGASVLRFGTQDAGAFMYPRGTLQGVAGGTLITGYTLGDKSMWEDISQGAAVVATDLTQEEGAAPTCLTKTNPLSTTGPCLRTSATRSGCNNPLYAIIDLGSMQEVSAVRWWFSAPYNNVCAQSVELSETADFAAAQVVYSVNSVQNAGAEGLFVELQSPVLAKYVRYTMAVETGTVSVLKRLQVLRRRPAADREPVFGLAPYTLKGRSIPQTFIAHYDVDDNLDWATRVPFPGMVGGSVVHEDQLYVAIQIGLSMDFAGSQYQHEIVRRADSWLDNSTIPGGTGPNVPPGAPNFVGRCEDYAPLGDKVQFTIPQVAETVTVDPGSDACSALAEALGEMTDSFSGQFQIVVKPSVAIVKVDLTNPGSGVELLDVTFGEANFDGLFIPSTTHLQLAGKDTSEHLRLVGSHIGEQFPIILRFDLGTETFDDADGPTSILVSGYSVVVGTTMASPNRIIVTGVTVGGTDPVLAVSIFDIDPQEGNTISLVSTIGSPVAKTLGISVCANQNTIVAVGQKASSTSISYVPYAARFDIATQMFVEDTTTLQEFQVPDYADNKRKARANLSYQSQAVQCVIDDNGVVTIGGETTGEFALGEMISPYVRDKADDTSNFMRLVWPASIAPPNPLLRQFVRNRPWILSGSPYISLSDATLEVDMQWDYNSYLGFDMRLACLVRGVETTLTLSNIAPFLVDQFGLSMFTPSDTNSIFAGRFVTRQFTLPTDTVLANCTFAAGTSATSLVSIEQPARLTGSLFSASMGPITITDTGGRQVREDLSNTPCPALISIVTCSLEQYGKLEARAPYGWVANLRWDLVDTAAGTESNIAEYGWRRTNLAHVSAVEVGLSKIFGLVLRDEGDVSILGVAQGDVYGQSTGVDTCSAASTGTCYDGFLLRMCGPGRYSDITVPNTCTSCPAGRFKRFLGDNSLGALADPANLTMGEEFPGALTACDVCSPGRATQETGSVGCDACAVGRYTPAFGSQTCVACPEGTTTNTTGADSLSRCQDTIPPELISLVPGVVGLGTRALELVFSEDMKFSRETDAGTSLTLIQIHNEDVSRIVWVKELVIDNMTLAVANARLTSSERSDGSEKVVVTLNDAEQASWADHPDSVLEIVVGGEALVDLAGNVISPGSKVRFSTQGIALEPGSVHSWPPPPYEPFELDPIGVGPAEASTAPTMCAVYQSPWRREQQPSGSSSWIGSPFSNFRQEPGTTFSDGSNATWAVSNNPKYSRFDPVLARVSVLHDDTPFEGADGTTWPECDGQPDPSQCGIGAPYTIGGIDVYLGESIADLSEYYGYHEWLLELPSGQGWTTNFRLQLQEQIPYPNPRVSVEVTAAGGADGLIRFQARARNETNPMQSEDLFNGKRYDATVKGTSHAFGVYLDADSSASLYIDGKLLAVADGVSIPDASAPLQLSFTTQVDLCTDRVCGGLDLAGNKVVAPYSGPYLSQVFEYRYRNASTCDLSSLCQEDCAAAAVAAGLSSDQLYCGRLGGDCACRNGFDRPYCNETAPSTVEYTVCNGTQELALGCSNISGTCQTSTLQSGECYAFTNENNSSNSVSPFPLCLDFREGLIRAVGEEVLPPGFNTSESSTSFEIVNGRIEVSYYVGPEAQNCSESLKVNTETFALDRNDSACSSLLPCVVPDVSVGKIVQLCGCPQSNTRTQCGAGSQCECQPGYSGDPASDCNGTFICTQACSLLPNAECTGPLSRCSCKSGWLTSRPSDPPRDIGEFGCQYRSDAPLPPVSASIYPSQPAVEPAQCTASHSLRSTLPGSDLNFVEAQPELAPDVLAFSKSSLYVTRVDTTGEDSLTLRLDDQPFSCSGCVGFPGNYTGAKTRSTEVEWAGYYQWRIQIPQQGYGWMMVFTIDDSAGDSAGVRVEIWKDTVDDQVWVSMTYLADVVTSPLTQTNATSFHVIGVYLAEDNANQAMLYVDGIIGLPLQGWSLQDVLTPKNARIGQSLECRFQECTGYDGPYEAIINHFKLFSNCTEFDLCTDGMSSYPCEALNHKRECVNPYEEYAQDSLLRCSDNNNFKPAPLQLTVCPPSDSECSSAECTTVVIDQLNAPGGESCALLANKTLVASDPSQVCPNLAVGAGPGLVYLAVRPQRGFNRASLGFYENPNCQEDEIATPIQYQGVPLSSSGDCTPISLCNILGDPTETINYGSWSWKCSEDCTGNTACGPLGECECAPGWGGWPAQGCPLPICLQDCAKYPNMHCEAPFGDCTCDQGWWSPDPLVNNTLSLPGAGAGCTIPGSGQVDFSSTASQTVSFYGSGFGSSANDLFITFDNDDGVVNECQLVSLSTIAPQQLICGISAGFGRDLEPNVLRAELLTFEGPDGAVSQVVQSLSEPSPDRLSFPGPIISPTTLRRPGETNSTGVIVALTKDGEAVQFDGQYFGDPATLVVTYARVNDTASEVCVVQVNQTSDSTVVCSTQAGEGADYVFTVLQGGQSFTGVDKYSYPVGPVIYEVQGCPSFDAVTNITSDCPTLGQIEIVIVGEFFFEDASRPLSLSVSGTPCGSPRLISQTEVRCTLPAGAGLSQIVSVTSLGITSTRRLVSYAEPTITAIETSPACVVAQDGSVALSGCPRNATGYVDADSGEVGVRISLRGSNFGPSGAKVLVGGLQADVDLNTHELVQFRLPNGAGVKAILVIQKGGELSRSPVSVAYAVCEPGTFVSDISCIECPEGTFSEFSGAKDCTECDAGRFGDQARQASCQPCDSGRFSSRGATSCKLCPPGTFSELQGAVSCAECPSGRYTASNGTKTCSLCNAGEYQPDTGKMGCLECAPGSFTDLASNKVQCDPCPIGTRGPLAKTTQCLPCAAGKFQAETGQEECIFCETGTFSDEQSAVSCAECPRGSRAETTSGATMCIPCEVGNYQPDVGKAECLPCPEGKYINVLGQASCLDCELGKFNNLTGQDQCTACPEGSFRGQTEANSTSTSANATACELCPRGKYSPTAGRLLCIDCEAGRFSDESGRNVCSKCSPGDFADQSGLQACAPCDSGTYATVEGSSTCLDCQEGKFTNETGQQTCQDCPIGRFGGATGLTECEECDGTSFQPEEGRANCRKCDTGSYSGVVDGVPTGKCFPCPVGVVCDEKGIRALKNYWVKRDPATGELGSLFCLSGRCLDTRSECPDSQGTPPASSAVSNGTLAPAAFYPVSCCSSNRLNPPSDNPVCGSCAEGYFEWGGDCVECDGANALLIFTFVVVSWCYVLAFHLISQSTRGETKIFLYFVQMSLLYMGRETEWLGFLSVFNFNIAEASGNSCVMPMSPVEKMSLNIVVPFFCLGQLVVTALVHHALYKCRVVQKQTELLPRAMHRWELSRYVRTALGLLLFSYNAITNTVFQFLTCVDAGRGSDGEPVSVVEAFPGISCESSEYNNLRFIFVLLCVIVVAGTPLVLLGGIVVAFKRGRLDDLRFLRRFGILYETYRPERFFYESVVLGRRVIAIAVTVVVTQREKMYSLVSVLNVVYLMSHVFLRPFKLPMENAMETLSLVLLCIITVLQSAIDVPFTTGESVVFGLLILLPAGSLAVYLVWSSIRRIKNKITVYRKGGAGLELTGMEEDLDDEEEDDDGLGSAEKDDSPGDEASDLVDQSAEADAQLLAPSPAADEAEPPAQHAEQGAAASAVAEGEGGGGDEESSTKAEASSVEAAGQKDLPPGWRIIDNDGKPYYWNDNLEESSWTRPEA